MDALQQFLSESLEKVETLELPLPGGTTWAEIIDITTLKERVAAVKAEVKAYGRSRRSAGVQTDDDELHLSREDLSKFLRQETMHVLEARKQILSFSDSMEGPQQRLRPPGSPGLTPLQESTSQSHLSQRDELKARAAAKRSARSESDREGTTNVSSSSDVVKPGTKQASKETLQKKLELKRQAKEQQTSSGEKNKTGGARFEDPPKVEPKVKVKGARFKASSSDEAAEGVVKGVKVEPKAKVKGARFQASSSDEMAGDVSKKPRAARFQEGSSSKDNTSPAPKGARFADTSSSSVKPATARPRKGVRMASSSDESPQPTTHRPRSQEGSPDEPTDLQRRLSLKRKQLTRQVSETEVSVPLSSSRSPSSAEKNAKQVARDLLLIRLGKKTDTRTEKRDTKHDKKSQKSSDLKKRLALKKANAPSSSSSAVIQAAPSSDLRQRLEAKRKSLQEGSDSKETNATAAPANSRARLEAKLAAKLQPTSDSSDGAPPPPVRRRSSLLKKLQAKREALAKKEMEAEDPRSVRRRQLRQKIRAMKVRVGQPLNSDDESSVVNAKTKMKVMSIMRNEVEPKDDSKARLKQRLAAKRSRSVAPRRISSTSDSDLIPHLKDVAAQRSKAELRARLAKRKQEQDRSPEELMQAEINAAMARRRAERGK